MHPKAKETLQSLVSYISAHIIYENTQKGVQN